MLKVHNIIDKQQYLKEVAELTQKEWGEKNLSKEEFYNKVNKKILRIKSNFDNPYYCKLILLDNEELIGFISIFPSDCEERKDLSPWYATMFIKKKYRGKGYSIILNNAILSEARKRNFKKIYLKTNLENYYEKLGANYIEKLKTGEKLYVFNL